MDKHDLTLDKYGISKKRYRELRYFCEQYPEWKSEVANQAFISSPKLDGMPHGAGSTGNPTLQAALTMQEKKERITLIEETAVQAADDMWYWLIRNVCYEIPVGVLVYADGMPMSASQFYDYRRYFFYLLDRNRR